MRRQNNVTVVSTCARDRLICENGSLLCEQTGGPAFYFARAFAEAKRDCLLDVGPMLGVQILITAKGEFGKVPKQPKPRRIRFSQIKTPALLISTVLDEIDLTGLAQYPGKVFFDAQGYVRDGKNFGKKKRWEPDEETFANIFCLKGTKEELRYLPPRFIRQQKKKILIRTDGKRGCVVFAFNERYAIKPRTVVMSKNTIGAGDTFLANFVMRFTDTGRVSESAKYAAKQTSAFLAAQQDNHHATLFREEIGCD